MTAATAAESSVCPGGRWATIAAGLIVLAAAACGSIGETGPVTAATTTSASAGTVTTLPPPAGGLTDLDLAYLAAYRLILQAAGGGVWPGWGQVIPPVLQLAEDEEYLVGHPAPPPPFAPSGRRVADAEIWTAPAGTIIPGPFATTWEVAGTWAVMVPVRRVFEEAVDEALGPGTVQWDDSTYLRAVFHESFHAFQLTTRGEVPSFGADDGDEVAVVGILSEIPGVEARYAEEAEALAAAVESAELGEMRRHAGLFLDLRAGRRAELPTVVADVERLIEWLEGTARYADVRLLTVAPGTGVVPGLQLTPGPLIMSTYLDDLAGTSTRPDGFRGWWQALGSAQGLVLDRLLLGWHEQLLVESRALEDLVAEAVAVPDGLAQFPLARIRLDETEHLVAVARTPEQWQAGLGGVVDLGVVEGLLLWFPEDVAGAGFTMEGARIPLDIAFFTAEGTLLDVTSMPLCATAPCPTYGPEAGFRFALEAPAGGLAGLAPGARLVLPAVSGG